MCVYVCACVYADVCVYLCLCINVCFLLADSLIRCLSKNWLALVIYMKVLLCFPKVLDFILFCLPHGQAINSDTIY